MALQLAALRATVNFEHVAVIPPSHYLGRGRRAAIKYFSKYTTILKILPGHFHAASLSTLLKYFIEQQKEFDGFLFLDSDAFPIRKGWLEILNKSMMGRRRWRHDIATIYRPEFGETRLHASVLYAKRQALKKLQFVYVQRQARGGGIEKDTYIDPYTNHWKRTYRLIRTNRINVHPMLAGVYGDMFYHYGCGSRRYRNNMGDDLWRPLVGRSYFERDISFRLQEKLVANPRAFLGQLLWDPSLCVLSDSAPSLDDL